jgi:hypothetical protein
MSTELKACPLKDHPLCYINRQGKCTECSRLRFAKKQGAHTPTPWKVRNWGKTLSISNGEIDGIAFINPGNSDNGIPDATDKANAAFIVRAVNAHMDMVFAIKRAMSALDDLSGTNAWTEGHAKVFKILEKAIAKAEARHGI